MTMQMKTMTDDNDDDDNDCNDNDGNNWWRGVYVRVVGG